MKSELSKKQQKLLLIIQEFINEYGQSPTLEELRERYGARSKRSISLLLNKLEKAGYILREKGVSRSIKLVRDENPTLEINMPSCYNPNVFNRLLDFDERAAYIYRDSLHLIQDQNSSSVLNEGCANGLRHIMSVFTRKHNKSNQSDENGMGGVNKLKTNLEAGNMLTPENNIWKEYKSLQKKITGISHFNGKNKNRTRESLILAIEDLNRIFYDYIFAEMESLFQRIDKIIQEGPDTKQINKLMLLISTNSSAYNYFFNRISENWLSNLDKFKLLKPNNATAKYLSIQKEDHFLDYVKSFKSKYKVGYFCKSGLSKENRNTLKNIGIIDNSLMIKVYNLDQFNKLIDQTNIKDNEKEDIRDLFIKKLNELVNAKETIITQFIKQYTIGNYQNLKELCKILKKGSWMDIPCRPYSVFHNSLIELIEKLIDEKKLDESSVFLDLLIQNYENVENLYIREVLDKYVLLNGELLLEVAVVIKEFLQNNAGNKVNAIWRSSIERSDITSDNISTIVTYYIRILKNIIKSSKDKNITFTLLSEKLFSQEGLLSNRIKLHLLKDFNEDLKEFAYNELMANLTNRKNLKKEYDKLLAHSFCLFNKKQQENLLDKILDSESKRDKLEALFLIKDNLNAKWTSTYKKLLDGEEQEKYKPIYSGLIHNYEVDYDFKDLSKLDLETTLKYLIEEDSGEEILKRRDLSKLVQGDIKSNPSKYFDELNVALSLDLNERYIIDILSYLDDNLDLKTFDHSNIITDLTNFLLNISQNNMNKYSYVGILIISILTKILSTKSYKINTESYESISLIINLFLDIKVEKIEERYLDRALNHPQGQTILELIPALLRRYKETPDPNLSRVIDSIKGTIITKLENKPNKILLSSIGFSYLNFNFYDKSWSKKIKELIFPIDNRETRIIGWESYLNSNVSINQFNDLKEVYLQSCYEVDKSGEVSGFININEGLFKHLISLLIYDEIKYEDEAIQLLYSKSKDNDKASVISFIGRIYIKKSYLLNPTKYPSPERLMRFWERRINESNEFELVAFGSWVKDGFFEQSKLLELIDQTTDLTNGKIYFPNRTLDLLLKLCEESPLVSAKILSKLVKFHTYNRLSYHIDLRKVHDIFELLMNHKNDENFKYLKSVYDNMMRIQSTPFEKFRNMFRKS